MTRSSLRRCVRRGPTRPSTTRLRQTARTEIDRHININGHCTIGAVVFPCERAKLAEMMLGSF